MQLFKLIKKSLLVWQSYDYADLLLESYHHFQNFLLSCVRLWRDMWDIFLGALRVKTPSQLLSISEALENSLISLISLVNSRPIGPIDEAEVRRHAKIIQESGVHTVAVVGIFSNIDAAEVTQEQKVKRLLEKYIPGVDVVCSRDMGSGGFIERENASIINASILALARETIGGFQNAVATLGLDCPLYLTQNDGTVMSAQAASITPIKTFSSGATVSNPSLFYNLLNICVLIITIKQNSLTGAVFLAGLHSPTSEINLHECQVIMACISSSLSSMQNLTIVGRYWRDISRFCCSVFQWLPKTVTGDCQSWWSSNRIFYARSVELWSGGRLSSS